MGKVHHLMDFAKRKEGKLLSNEYRHANEKVQWQCKEGHSWANTWSNIYHKNEWCPHCANRAKRSIELANKLAERRGGTCISTKYVNVFSALNWRCKEGHIWQTSYNSVQQGSWCPHCAGKARKTIEYAR